MSLIKEPLWSTVQPTDIHNKLGEWLFEQGSLTKKLSALDPQTFKVNVLKHAWHEARQTENYHLNLITVGRTIIRETELFCHDHVYIYARSIFPEVTLNGCGKDLATLGATSLGEVLFKDPSLSVGKRWYAKFHSIHYDFKHATKTLKNNPYVLWGRRTLYFFYQNPLLVTEIFLPIAYSG